MKRLNLTLLLFFVIAHLGVSNVFAKDKTENQTNVTGTWDGVNYTSKVSGPSNVRLILNQEGDQVTGIYYASTGVGGKGEGVINGSNMEIKWVNTTPSCPGTYLNKYDVEGSQMTWTFTGEDCLGSEEGHGYAHLVNP